MSAIVIYGCTLKWRLGSIIMHLVLPCALYSPQVSSTEVANNMHWSLSTACAWVLIEVFCAWNSLSCSPCMGWLDSIQLQISQPQACMPLMQAIVDEYVWLDNSLATSSQSVSGVQVMLTAGKTRNRPYNYCLAYTLRRQVLHVLQVTIWICIELGLWVRSACMAMYSLE